MENSITSVFVNVENIEEVLQVLTAILKFSANQKINETYSKKVGEVRFSRRKMSVHLALFNLVIIIFVDVEFTT